MNNFRVWPTTHHAPSMSVSQWRHMLLWWQQGSLQVRHVFCLYSHELRMNKNAPRLHHLPDLLFWILMYRWMHYSVYKYCEWDVKCFNSNVCGLFQRCPPQWKGEYCQTNTNNVVASSSIFDFFIVRNRNKQHSKSLITAELNPIINKLPFPPSSVHVPPFQLE